MFTAVIKHEKTGQLCRYYGDNLKQKGPGIFILEPSIKGFKLESVLYRVQENVWIIGDKFSNKYVKQLPSYNNLKRKGFLKENYELKFK